MNHRGHSISDTYPKLTTGLIQYNSCFLLHRPTWGEVLINDINHTTIVSLLSANTVYSSVQEFIPFVVIMCKLYVESTCVCVYVCVCVCVCVCLCVLYIRTYVCVCVFMCVFVHVCLCACSCVWVVILYEQYNNS